jgi:hypothetical protein
MYSLLIGKKKIEVPHLKRMILVELTDDAVVFFDMVLFAAV